MKIDKISIQNFKGFENVEFNLNPHFTVFIGDNATGKTSVLDALSIAAGSFFLGIDVATQRGVHKDEIRTKTIKKEPKPQLPVIIKAQGCLFDEAITWSRNVDKISTKITTKYKEATHIKELAQRALTRSRAVGDTTLPVIAYHGTGRLWAEHESVIYKKDDEGIEMAYKNCLSPKSSSREFLSWYKTMEDEISKFGDKDDKVLLTAFQEAILEMMPKQSWKNMHFSFKRNDLIGTFVTPENKEEQLEFKQLSDGYRNIIGMVADIAYRCIKLNPHLGSQVIKMTNGIVLIDEIDQNIHPKWQKRLVADLKRTFPSIQFIATTHSPFIVQSLNSDELYNLDHIVDSVPSEYNVGEISTLFMGVDSEYSAENTAKYNESLDFLKHLEKGASPDELEEMLNKISDPAMRAFLNLNKMAKGK